MLSNPSFLEKSLAVKDWDRERSHVFCKYWLDGYDPENNLYSCSCKNPKNPNHTQWVNTQKRHERRRRIWVGEEEGVHQKWKEIKMINGMNMIKHMRSWNYQRKTTILFTWLMWIQCSLWSVLWLTLGHCLDSLPTPLYLCNCPIWMTAPIQSGSRRGFLVDKSSVSIWLFCS